MNDFQKEIDERASLTQSNKFELLLFGLGKHSFGNQSGLYGINVFKLREIVSMQKIHRAAGMQSPLLGMTNIRGKVIPVIDLAAATGCISENGPNLLLITEYARSVQAFAIESIENIIRLDWEQVHTASKDISSPIITSIARIEDNKFAMILDVEKILYDIIPSLSNKFLESSNSTASPMRPGAVAIVAEDSKVVLSMLEHGLSTMNIPSITHYNGLSAWETIKKIAKEASDAGQPILDRIGLVLTDIEMPEMDGFTLTRNIKTSPELKDIPVIIHSSLSGSANEEHVRKIGADGYVAKYDITELSAAIERVLGKNI